MLIDRDAVGVTDWLTEYGVSAVHHTHTLTWLCMLVIVLHWLVKCVCVCVLSLPRRYGTVESNYDYCFIGSSIHNTGKTFN